jgi:hypothetical protein
MLGDFVVIYSTRASNVCVTILENSINCSDISGDIETEPITTIAPNFYIEISLPNIFPETFLYALIMAALLQSF